MVKHNIANVFFACFFPDTSDVFSEFLDPDHFSGHFDLMNNITLKVYTLFGLKSIG